MVKAPALTGELELLGTDTRRQTNLDGFLRLLQKMEAGQIELIDCSDCPCLLKDN